MKLEVPKAFEDVAVEFSKEEWDMLSNEQKELHKEVMIQNYKSMVSIGYNIPVDRLWLYIKKDETVTSGNIGGEGEMVQQKQLPDNSINMMDSSVKLWQFLLQLLEDKKNENLISWTNNDGEFKFCNAEEVARLWGRCKNKTSMNYDKLRRALQYYYGKNIIKKVRGQKFVYKFVSFPEAAADEMSKDYYQRAVQATESRNTVMNRKLVRSRRHDFMRSGLYSTFTIWSLRNKHRNGRTEIFPQLTELMRQTVKAHSSTAKVLVPSAQEPAGCLEVKPGTSEVQTPSFTITRCLPDVVRGVLEVNVQSSEDEVIVIKDPSDGQTLDMVSTRTCTEPLTSEVEIRFEENSSQPPAVKLKEAEKEKEVGTTTGSQSQRGKKPKDFELPFATCLLPGSDVDKDKAAVNSLVFTRSSSNTQTTTVTTSHSLVPEIFQDASNEYSRNEWKVITKEGKELYKEVIIKSCENVVSVDPSHRSSHVKYFNSACDNTWSDKLSFERHDPVQTESTTYNHVGSNERFKKSKQKMHMQTQGGERSSRWSNCRFTNDHSPGAHPINDTGQKPYKCVTCNKDFMTKSSLVIHQVIHTGLKPYVCTTCGKDFTQKANMIKHQSIHTGMKPYKCDLCDKCFTAKQSLISHQTSHTKQKPYKCAICSRIFALKAVFVRHQHIHSGQKPHKCTTCNKSFASKEDMVRHQHIHTGHKRYKCATCGKAFTSKSYMIQHQYIHSEQKPYKCTTCDKGFTAKSNLASHEIIHTGQKPYKCPTCGRGFALKGNMIVHQYVHTKHKPYKCAMCGKGFIRESTMLKHQYMHTGQKPHKCHTCGKGFTRNSTMVRHQHNCFDLP
ncbi:zinc finger protein 569-like isoform X2 [Protopterus annectens]|uniref:zinc finger protein 569-like isoform X2 n=1 Tax=Protopterus annectens TaxID=7888 RepID=UPI001CFA7E6A|nr:zinc finger protein 569-like isoform X2 [Protopterus annectens]